MSSYLLCETLPQQKLLGTLYVQNLAVDLVYLVILPVCS